jgi:hypothetical protein
MAAARDHAIAEPTARIFVNEYADPGIQCCWCDCPVEQHQDPGYRCAGCPEDAVYMVHAMPEKPWDKTYPLCERHRWGHAQLYQEACGIPIEVLDYDAYDHDVG